LALNQSLDGIDYGREPVLVAGVMNMTTGRSVSAATDVPGFVDRIIRPLTHLLNPLILRIAGGWWFPMFSLLHHRGRRSGRIYVTPVTAFPRGGFFWLGLAFGENSGWARNVIAAGDADLRYRGTDYHLVEATVVAVADVKSELPRIVGYGSALAGMPKVLRMRPITKK
jgi:deazaflavin-dependent oxidoreductase (nitroreductase family)